MKKFLIVILLSIAPLFASMDQDIVSPSILPGVSYEVNGALLGDLPTAYWSLGIKERIEIGVANWQFITAYVKVNLKNVGENQLFRNRKTTIYFGSDGLSLLEMMSSFTVGKGFIGVSYGTSQRFLNGTELECILSPNITLRIYQNYSEYYDDNPSERPDYDTFQLLVQLPVGVRIYLGKKVRYYISGGVVVAGQIYSDSYDIQPRYIGTAISMGMGINIGTRKSRKKLSETFCDGCER